MFYISLFRGLSSWCRGNSFLVLVKTHIQVHLKNILDSICHCRRSPLHTTLGLTALFVGLNAVVYVPLSKAWRNCSLGRWLCAKVWMNRRKSSMSESLFQLFTSFVSVVVKNESEESAGWERLPAVFRPQRRNMFGVRPSGGEKGQDCILPLCDRKGAFTYMKDKPERSLTMCLLLLYASSLHLYTPARLKLSLSVEAAGPGDLSMSGSTDADVSIVILFGL